MKLKNILLENVDGDIDFSVTFISPIGKMIGFKYDFLSVKDKELKKIFDYIKNRICSIDDFDKKILDEIELNRNLKQSGTLNQSNNKLFLYVENVSGKKLLKCTKNKNLAIQKSLSSKNA